MSSSEESQNTNNATNEPLPYLELSESVEINELSGMHRTSMEKAQLIESSLALLDRLRSVLFEQESK